MDDAMSCPRCHGPLTAFDGPDRAVQGAHGRQAPGTDPRPVHSRRSRTGGRRPPLLPAGRKLVLEHLTRHDLPHLRTCGH